MDLPLVSHINGEGDILRAWCRHYRALGVTRFHIIAHGPEAENRTLLALQREFPIEIRDPYVGPYRGREKKERTNAVLATLSDRWVLVVDGDEFLELPGSDVADTIRLLEMVDADALPAPMVQRVRADGSLGSPALIEDPFREFPLCAPDLYRAMGVKAELAKHPLFYCRAGTRLDDGGNHGVPAGARAAPSLVRGVTHHFKWRASVMGRLTARAAIDQPWRHESVGFLAYLEGSKGTLPLDGAFPYSRTELFRRRLLRRPTRLDLLVMRARPAFRRVLPAALRERLARAYARSRGRFPR